MYFLFLKIHRSGFHVQRRGHNDRKERNFETRKRQKEAIRKTVKSKSLLSPRCDGHPSNVCVALVGSAHAMAASELR